MNCLNVDSDQIPLDLLLEADPLTTNIETYLSDNWGFMAINEHDILAACIVKPMSAQLAEIINIAVYPKHQGKGIGTELLTYVLAQLPERGINRVELGTGTFGHQLSYYQRAGFRVDAIIKDHFVRHYPTPIFENGIQHQDMLRLYKQL